jgi:hypothetical protein
VANPNFVIAATDTQRGTSSDIGQERLEKIRWALRSTFAVAAAAAIMGSRWQTLQRCLHYLIALLINQFSTELGRLRTWEVSECLDSSDTPDFNLFLRMYDANE